MRVFDADPLLRRLETRAVAFVAGAAAVAVAARRGEVDVALGVLGGGVLIGVSYWAIRASADGLVALLAGGREPGGAGSAPSAISARKPRPAAVGVVVRLVGRYALLAVMAYAMIARFRLHPIGLLVGVSSVFASASVEVVRLLGGSGRGAPR